MNEENTLGSVIKQKTRHDRIVELGDRFLDAIQDENDYGEIFQSLATVLFSQVIGFLQLVGKEVNEENLKAQYQQIMNRSAQMALSALQDPIFLANLEAAKEAHPKELTVVQD